MILSHTRRLAGLLALVSLIASANVRAGDGSPGESLRSLSLIKDGGPHILKRNLRFAQNSERPSRHSTITWTSLIRGRRSSMSWPEPRGWINRSDLVKNKRVEDALTELNRGSSAKLKLGPSQEYKNARKQLVQLEKQVQSNPMSSPSRKKAQTPKPKRSAIRER